MPRKLRTFLVCLFISSLIISLGLQINIPNIEALETEVLNIEENYMTPDEFFLRLETGLGIDLENVYDYGFCSKQISYLIDEGLLDNYTAYTMVSFGNYSAATFINKGLQVCGYFKRPLDANSSYEEIERVAIDTGLISEDSNIDLFKKLPYDEAEKILQKLISNDFKRVDYVDNDFVLNYKLYEFTSMSNTFRKVKKWSEKLPNRCIEEFARQGYELRIVPNVMQYYTGNSAGKMASAFINFDRKQIYIQRNNEEDIFHEFGHLMLDRLSNKNSVCNYLYKEEGFKANDFNYVRYENGAEELLCDCFEFLFVYSEDEEKINEFKEKCPKIYWLITEGILNTEVKSSRWSIDMTKLRKVGI